MLPPKIIKDFIEKFRLKDDRVSTYYFINSLVGDVYSNINATDSVIGRSNIVNKANETFEFLDWIIGQDSSNEYAWFTKGLIYNNLQKYNEAIKCYDKSLAIYSDWIFISKVWNAKGIALQNLGKIEESKIAKNKAEEYRIGHETGHM
jgi:tetratricopeptide (TPR) repeat protein